MGLDTWIAIGRWLEKTFGIIPGVRGITEAWRRQIMFPILEKYHRLVVHPCRKLGEQLRVTGLDDDVAATYAEEVCTGCREAMGDLLRMKPRQFHCCVKFLPEQDDVCTLVRSFPHDQRPVSPKDSHPIVGNTVWAALMGLEDGHRSWSQVNVFCSNDLYEHAGNYSNSRKDWQKFYRSTLALPIRFEYAPASNDFVTVGYLTFDSLEKNVFPGFPNIFSHADNLSHYQQLAEETAIFQLGAMMADTLAMALSNAYDVRSEEDTGREA